MNWNKEQYQGEFKTTNVIKMLNKFRRERTNAMRSL